MYTWVPFSFSHGQEIYTLQKNKINSPSQVNCGHLQSFLPSVIAPNNLSFRVYLTMIFGSVSNLFNTS